MISQKLKTSIVEKWVIIKITLIKVLYLYIFDDIFVERKCWLDIDLQIWI